MPKISELTDAAAVTGAEEIPVVQSGTTKRMSVSELLALAANATQAELDAAIAALSTVYQPLDADLTAIAALTTPATTVTGAAQKSANLSDLANAATAFGNIKQAASESATGVVEIATVAEAVAGTDTGRVVTPQGVMEAITNRKTVYNPGDFVPANGRRFPGRMSIKTAVIAGGSAGDHAVTGITTDASLNSVIRLNRDGTAANINISDLTSEFTITASDTVNNTAGTDTTGDSLLVLWSVEESHIYTGLIFPEDIDTTAALTLFAPIEWDQVDIHAIFLAESFGSGTARFFHSGDTGTAVDVEVAASYLGVLFENYTFQDVPAYGVQFAQLALAREGTHANDDLNQGLSCLGVVLLEGS